MTKPLAQRVQEALAFSAHHAIPVLADALRELASRYKERMTEAGRLEDYENDEWDIQSLLSGRG